MNPRNCLWPVGGFVRAKNSGCSNGEECLGPWGAAALRGHCEGHRRPVDSEVTSKGRSVSRRPATRRLPAKPPPRVDHFVGDAKRSPGSLYPGLWNANDAPTQTLPGLCLVILGGGGQIGPPGFWLTHPPTHIRKFFLRKKMKFIKGARTWRSILGTQTFFWPLTPPPPRYSINQPLSKGLDPSPHQ